MRRLGYICNELGYICDELGYICDELGYRCDELGYICDELGMEWNGMTMPRRHGRAGKASPAGVRACV